ncbi:protein EMBRYONIC FLOWER 1-like [Silene latifolia]|uniref:protein EMBRYONIC FLOWER 1-like n=1 Tax=Silene latifolia TaxID=37657 RepID=UPI003D788D87
MASAIVELNHQNDSSLTSKSTRLHAPVDSAPVDNPCDEKSKEVERKCNHFSIRGYVSEVRKRDPKLCYPFTLKDSTDPGHELPHMVIPNFRWWRCITCVPEAKNELMRDSGGAGNGEAQNDVKTDASILMIGQSSKENAGKVRNTEASTSTDSNENKNHPPTLADLKRKGKAHIYAETPVFSGCENGILKVSVSQRIPQQTLGQLEAEPSADSEVKVGSTINQNGTIKGLYRDCRAGRTEVGPSEGYETCKVDYVTKTCVEEPQTSSQLQRVGSPTNGVAGIVSGSFSHSQGLVNLPDLNKYSGGPSYVVKHEATVTLNNINNFCEDDDDYLGAERRKKPKVRLLSELLSCKVTQNPAKGKKKILPSASSHDDHIKRKRVGYQEEGFKSMETDDGTRKNVGTSEVSGSEYESDSDDVSTEKISEALTKRHCKSKDPLLERKNKKIKVDNGDSSSMSRQKIKQKSSHEKGKVSEELPQNLDFFARLSEKNSVLTKKRGKNSQNQKEPTSLTLSKSRMPKECGTTRKHGEADQNATENARKASENGHYFLSSYLNKENDHLRVPRNDGPHLSSSQAEQIPVAGNTVQKDGENRNIEEASATFRPTSACAPDKVNQLNGASNICPTTDSSKKNSETREADECSPVAQQMSMQVSNSVANQKELTNEVRGRIQDIDINSIPTDDKSNEQGVGDDIPMDIVELMAKNQYERHLNDPKDRHDFSGPPVLSGTNVRPTETYGSYGQHLKTFAQSHFLRMQKPPSTDPRIPLFNEDLGHYTYCSSNHVGVRGLPRFLTPSQALDHAGPYSHTLTPNNWNGNLNVQRYPQSFLQAVDSYQKQRGMAPRPSISNSHHLWPSGTSSRMPVGITNPQMLSPGSNVVNKGRTHHQSSGSFLNFEKHQNLNFSNAYNSGNPDSSASSVDVNEAIPAMHLLSLMQNSAKVQNTELSLGPQKVMGPPTSFRFPFTKNNGRTTTIQDHNSSHPCYPTPRPFPLPYPNDNGNIVRNSAGFVGPIPLTLQGQRKMGSSHFGPSSRDHQPMRRPMAPPRDKGKGVASLPKPAYVNSSVQAVKDSSSLHNVAGVRRNENTVSLAPDKVICQLNQNPSEFNDLKLVAQFMIGPEDLKPRKIARNKAPRPRPNPKRQNIKVFKPIPSLTTAEG